MVMVMRTRMKIFSLLSNLSAADVVEEAVRRP